MFLTFKKWTAFYLLTLLLLFAGFAAILWQGSAINASKNLTLGEGGGGTVLVVDPGHGGIDGGAVAADGTVEAQINLAVALQMEELAIRTACPRSPAYPGLRCSIIPSPAVRSWRRPSRPFSMRRSMPVPRKRRRAAVSTCWSTARYPPFWWSAASCPIPRRRPCCVPRSTRESWQYPFSPPSAPVCVRACF